MRIAVSVHWINPRHAFRLRVFCHRYASRHLIETQRLYVILSLYVIPSLFASLCLFETRYPCVNLRPCAFRFPYASLRQLSKVFHWIARHWMRARDCASRPRLRHSRVWMRFCLRTGLLDRWTTGSDSRIPEIRFSLAYCSEPIRVLLPERRKQRVPLAAAGFGPCLKDAGLQVSAPPQHTHDITGK